MEENRSKKRPYVKPMLVFEDSVTGELRGSPEMIAQIQRKRREQAEQSAVDHSSEPQSVPGRKGPAEDG